MSKIVKIGLIAALVIILGAFMLSQTFVGRLIFPLPFAGPHAGRVADCRTGQPITQAIVTATWWCHDNPFPDSPGQFTVTVSAITDQNGGFVLPKPRRRGGLFSSHFSLHVQADSFVKAVLIVDPKNRDLPQSTKQWPFVKTTLEKALPKPLALCLEPELPVLIAAIATDDEFIRTTAAQKLASYGPLAAEAVNELVPLLDEADADIRQAAALALGAIGKNAAPAFEKLLALINDPDEGVREKAASALGEIGANPQEAVGALVGLLDDHFPAVREAAVKSLPNFGLLLAQQEALAPENEPGLTPDKSLEQTSDQGPDQIPGRVLLQRVIQALLSAQDDPSTPVREAAESAIMRLEQLSQNATQGP
ncbi:MAG: HEAT repeat domain-containing protein [Desulfatibacillaceae bacterium]|nr:HEAT repeat domain-containing protein [Desulfatibacillaceae bacterium]